MCGSSCVTLIMDDETIKPYRYSNQNEQTQMLVLLGGDQGFSIEYMIIAHKIVLNKYVTVAHVTSCSVTDKWCNRKYKNTTIASCREWAPRARNAVPSPYFLSNLSISSRNLSVWTQRDRSQRLKARLIYTEGIRVSSIYGCMLTRVTKNRYGTSDLKQA